MELQTLRFFCTVAKEGSLSKAAAKLHYAQSNLSTKMIQLEQEVGAPLFYRNNHGVTLTQKGELLLTYATNMLRLESDTIAAMKDDMNAAGIIKIGSMESAVVAFLSKHLTEFYHNHPKISIQVETGTSDLILQKILDDTLDGGFIAGPIKRNDVEVKKIRTEKLCLIVSDILAQGKSMEDILMLPLLVFPSGCTYRKIFERYVNNYGITCEKIYEFTTLNAVFASVTAGLGIALFPESCIRQYEQNGNLKMIELPKEYALADTVFVYKKDRYLSTAMRSFINAINV